MVTFNGYNQKIFRQASGILWGVVALSTDIFDKYYYIIDKYLSLSPGKRGLASSEGTEASGNERLPKAQ